MTRWILSLALVALALPAFAADGMDEVNAARAARGLRPFVRDAGLTAAAEAAANFRAQHRIAGHVTGGQGDFGFLPPGSTASAAGCGALAPSWGWGTCCTYENHRYAGAAVVYGQDGKRYMHLFVSNSPSAGMPASGVEASASVPAATPPGVAVPEDPAGPRVGVAGVTRIVYRDADGNVIKVEGDPSK